MNRSYLQPRVLAASVLTVSVFAVSVVGVSRAIDQAPQTPETLLSAMTFNIRYANPNDGSHRWELRKEWVAEVINTSKPDFLGLQEALRHQIDSLIVRLPAYDWVGQGRDDGMDAGEFSPVFYRTDRLSILSTGTFWLSPAPDSVASRGWDAALPRIATWAQFRDNTTGAVLYHFNTHFDHVGETAREESARLLRDRIAAIAGSAPFVVTGDFNATEDSAPYQELIRTRKGVPPMTDSRVAATESDGASADTDLTTFRGFEIGSATNRRIDYVFFSSQFKILTHEVLDESRDGSFPSDHLPVLAAAQLQIEE